MVELAGDRRATWAALGRSRPAAAEPLPDPGWPALDKGTKGDEVVWLQEHLVAFSPDVPVDGVFGTATQQALMRLPDLARPARERRDRRRDLAGGARPAGAAGGLGVARLGCAGRGGRGPARPASARLPARRDEIPPAAQRR